MPDAQSDVIFDFGVVSVLDKYDPIPIAKKKADHMFFFVVLHTNPTAQQVPYGAQKLEGDIVSSMLLSMST